MSQRRIMCMGKKVVNEYDCVESDVVRAQRYTLN